MAENFEVHTITRTVMVGPGGITGPGMEVAFTTKPSKIEGAVRIPEQQFSEDAVRQAVAAAATTLENVKAL